MDSPLNRHTDQTSQPDCFDLSPERLNSMSASELEAAMEEALAEMTEENYDPAVIDAYLDALDQRAPMPEYPDAKTSYANFQKKIQHLSGAWNAQPSTSRHTVRLRKGFRVALVAALIVACLFGSMVAAQAAGVDVFGAMARWTESVFGFGALPSDVQGDGTSSLSARTAESDSPNGSDVPEEYQEVQAALEERGLTLYYPKIPEGFEAQEPLLYIDSVTDCVGFTIAYTQNSNCISYNVEQKTDSSSIVYEKDANDVELYEYNGVSHYIFKNVANKTVAWVIENVEYCITINLDSMDIKKLIQSVYEE